MADRCITVSMQRKTAEEECERLRDLDGSEMRRKCARFVIDHAAEIAAARPEIPKSLNDRAADIWETLLALADLAGGEWPKLARDAAEHLSAKGRENNALSSLLFDVLVAFVQLGGEKAHSHDLVTQLNFRTGRAWQELLKGRPATEVWLSQQLRPYGVRPRSIWINGVSRKGYMKEDFGDIFKRYIPKAEAQELFEELRRPDQEEEVNSKQ